MAERTLNMEMANLICRFGSEKVLLDFVEDIVIPAFLKKNRIRSYGKTRYFFHETQLVSLSGGDNKVVGIVGRFVKDTTLSREQVFTDNGLVRDPGYLQSSPSAVFLLILNNHRFIYVKETMDAPTKDSFRSTLLDFLYDSRNELIDNIFIKNKEDRKKNPELVRVTKKELRLEYPRPSLELIPLTSDESIEGFIGKYKVLKSVEISFSGTNDESDNNEFFEDMQRRRLDIGSVKTVLRHSNPGGLDKEVAMAEISEATAQGNQEVKLSGEDMSGDVLRGNNEEFQLRKPIDELGGALPGIAVNLYRSFSELVKDGLVKIPEMQKKTADIINYLAGRISR